MEKGFVGEGEVRWCDRPSSAAHWASKASSCGTGGKWGIGCGTPKAAAAAQLSAPLKVALPLRERGLIADTLTKGPVLPNTGVSCWGGVEAEPKTLATICDGVMPTTGTLCCGNANPLAIG